MNMFSLMPMTRKMVSPQNNFYSMKNIFDDIFDDFPVVSVKNDMKIDLIENDNEYVIEAELAGMKKENIKLDVEDNKLVISANVEENKEEEKQNYIHRERRYSSLSRMIYLPNIDEESIKAKYTDGILSVTIPKKQVVENKK